MLRGLIGYTGSVKMSREVIYHVRTINSVVSLMCSGEWSTQVYRKSIIISLILTLKGYAGYVLHFRTQMILSIPSNLYQNVKVFELQLQSPDINPRKNCGLN